MANRQGENKIDWTDWTLNPVKGLCPEGCFYCYMREFFKRFGLDETLRLDEKELKWKPKEKGQKIFVCSNIDLFHPLIPDEWKRRVIENAWNNGDSTYQFLTKSPENYRRYEFPRNSWLGTTVDGLARTIWNLDIIAEWGVFLKEKHEDRRPLTFVSFEPLKDFYYSWVCVDWRWKNIDWIIIGADSRKGQPKPPDSWADILIEKAMEFNVPVWVKDNYKYRERIKNFPVSLT